ncbi:MAG TPA: purine-nucleoside phosphorylase [Candidatus Cloacimonetes bacterium]|nr:purine-nucleoside phosphorylase [Candidatus Cloacimonadota bacterium]HEX38337.1 purine-nucleoside phosphorylase [Candidatus Cloacimonadota bacterium]
MKKIIEQIPESVAYIRQLYDNVPEVGIILGTGLNELTHIMEIDLEIPYQDIPHFRISTAPSHQGKMLFGSFHGINIIILQGRLHCYEGYSALETTYPVFVMKELGIKTLIVTNAVGSLRRDFEIGDLIAIKDHINLTGMNPLVGKNDGKLGIRFPSMQDAYSKEYREVLNKAYIESKMEYKEGIYAGLLGPSLETPAECKMLKTIGADMVGMSTVHEVIVGVYLGLKILGISTITNLSNLFHNDTHVQDEIEQVAKSAQKRLKALIQKFLMDK